MSNPFLTPISIPRKRNYTRAFGYDTDGYLDLRDVRRRLFRAAIKRAYKGNGSKTRTTTEKEMEESDSHRSIAHTYCRVSNGRRRAKNLLPRTSIVNDGNYSGLIESLSPSQGFAHIAAVGTYSQMYGAPSILGELNGPNNCFPPLITINPNRKMVGSSDVPEIGTVLPEQLQPLQDAIGLNYCKLSLRFQNFSTGLVEMKLFVVEARKDIPRVASATGGDIFGETDALEQWQDCLDVEANYLPTHTGVAWGHATRNNPGTLPTSNAEWRKLYKVHRVMNFELSGGAAQYVDIDISTNLYFDYSQDVVRNQLNLTVPGNTPAKTMYDADQWRSQLKRGGFDVFAIVKGQVIPVAAGGCSYSDAKVGFICQRKMTCSLLQDRVSKFKFNGARNQLTAVAFGAGQQVTDAKDAATSILKI